MKGAYDDLTQETWGRADADMPQEYLDAILAQCTPKRPQPADHLDSIQQVIAVEAKMRGRRNPRKGQPSFNAPLIEWYRENQVRNQLEAAELTAKFA